MHGVLLSCSLSEISSLKPCTNLPLREEISGKMLFLPKAIFLLKRDSAEKNKIKSEKKRKHQEAKNSPRLGSAIKPISLQYTEPTKDKYTVVWYQMESLPPQIRTFPDRQVAGPCLHSSDSQQAGSSCMEQLCVLLLECMQSAKCTGFETSLHRGKEIQMWWLPLWQWTRDHLS